MLRIIALSLLLSGCASYNPEQARSRAAEKNKADLCSKLETQRLPHCPGYYVPPPPFHPDANIPADDKAKRK